MEKKEFSVLHANAQKFFTKTNNERAKGRVKRIFAQPLNNFEYYLQVAEVFEENDAYEQALACIDQGLKAHPQNIALGLKKAWIYFDIFEDVDESYSILKNIEKIFKNKKINELKKIYEEEILLDAYLLLIDCYRLKKDYTQAYYYAKYCRTINEKSDLSLLAFATACFELGQYKKALFLTESKVENAKNADFLWLKGLILCAMGEFKLADRCFYKAKNKDKSKYHKPIRLLKTEFDVCIEQAIFDLPKEIREFIKKLNIESKEIIDRETIIESKGSIAPQDCLVANECFNEKRLTLYKKNVENLSAFKEEIKEVIASALLHKLSSIIAV